MSTAPTPWVSVPELTRTGFVLLAQIAREPISPYQLTQLMRRNIHYLWPRAESRIYGEVARLEAAGCLASKKASVGRRTRSVLSITATGREAVRQWLNRGIEPGIALQSEALLRIFFATLGSVDDLRRALEQIRSEAAELLLVAGSVGEQYLQGGGSAPEQAHVRAMTHELLSGYAEWLLNWSTQNLNAVARWSDLDGQDKRNSAMKHFARTLDLIQRPATVSQGKEPAPGRPARKRG